MANFNCDLSLSNRFIVDKIGSDLLGTAATSCLSVACYSVVNCSGAEYRGKLVLCSGLQ